MAYQLTPKHAKLWLPVVRELRNYVIHICMKTVDLTIRT